MQNVFVQPSKHQRLIQEIIVLFTANLHIFILTRLCSLALLQLVQVVGASVVNIMAEACSHHGHGLQVSVVTLQVTCLRKFRDNVGSRNATCLNNSNEIYKMSVL